MNQTFENLTISQLRKITEDYERLKKENKYFKIKYPNKIPPTRKNIEKDAQEIINEIDEINKNKIILSKRENN